MKRILSFLLVICLALTLSFVPVSAAATTHKDNFSVNYSNGSNFAGEVRVPNYVGQLLVNLPINGSSTRSVVYVVLPSASAWSGSTYSGAVTVEVTKTNRYMIAGAESDSYKLGYHEDTGYTYSRNSGTGTGDAMKGSLIYRNGPGLYQGKVKFAYSFRDLGYDSLSKIPDDKKASVQYFTEGVSYVLVLNQTMVDNFLKTGTLGNGDTFSWPGLKTLLQKYASPSEENKPAVPVPDPPSMSNFKVKNSYVTGRFLDVNAADWFEPRVEQAYEYGLMTGSSETLFRPKDYLTVAEVIAAASRVHNIYNGGSGHFTQGSPWYQVYVDYARKNGLLPDAMADNYDRVASRAEMAYIFAHALPASELPAINSVSSLPDVNTNNLYSESIFLLYNAGVLTGNDEIGTFKPGHGLNRAEAAAIISRLILPDAREYLSY